MLHKKHLSNTIKLISNTIMKGGYDLRIKNRRLELVSPFLTISNHLPLIPKPLVYHQYRV
jgi:hypothetical protein